MQTRTWLLITLFLILGAGGALIGLNAAVDLYGLWRPVQGRQLLVYGDERVAKYLFNMRYVPENFNAVLIGTSVSANWNMRGIEKLRVYNNSLDGGNIVEGKAITEETLSRPGITTAFLLVHPALTFSHDYETVDLVPRLRLSTLGSLSLWDAYKDLVNIRLGRARQLFDYAGTETFEKLRSEMTPHMKALWSPGESFDIDPVALAAYRDVVRELHAHQVRIIFVVPPTFEGLLEQKRPAFDRYVRLIQSELVSGDKWIDFTTDEYEAFRRVHSKFPDGTHLTTEAAKELVDILNAKVDEWIAREELGWARGPGSSERRKRTARDARHCSFAGRS